MEQITVCLLGDDRERSYPVVYEGVADFPKWEREDGSATCGELPVALIRDGADEHLVAQHPDYGWCSVGEEFCRDFSPAIDQQRIEKAR